MFSRKHHTVPYQAINPASQIVKYNVTCNIMTFNDNLRNIVNHYYRFIGYYSVEHSSLTFVGNTCRKRGTLNTSRNSFEVWRI